MNSFAGLDVSIEETAICVVDDPSAEQHDIDAWNAAKVQRLSLARS